MSNHPKALRVEIRRVGRRLWLLVFLPPGLTLVASACLVIQACRASTAGGPLPPPALATVLVLALALLLFSMVAGAGLGALLAAVYRLIRRRDLRRRLARLATAEVEAVLLPMARENLEETRSLAYSLYREVRRGSEVVPCARVEGNGHELSASFGQPDTLRSEACPGRVRRRWPALALLCVLSAAAAGSYAVRQARPPATLPPAPEPAWNAVIREGVGWRVTRARFPAHHGYILRQVLEVMDPEGGSRTSREYSGGDRVGPSFVGADLHRIWAPGMQFRRLRFTGANLREAYLERTRFRFCDFSGADLTGARLCGASFAFADLTGANLQGAEYDGETLWPPGFDPQAAGARRVE